MGLSLYKKSLILFLVLLIPVIIYHSEFLLSNEEITTQKGINLSNQWNLSPFIIDDSGSGDFTWAQASLQPWCHGSGSLNDPYIIENIDIDSENKGNCLIIRNSDKFFIIRNSTFFNSNWDGSGDSSKYLTNTSILLENVINGILKNNTFHSNMFGISMYRTNITTITDNVIKNNAFGLHLESGRLNELVNNAFNLNVYDIWADSANENKIIGNAFTNGDCAIFFERFCSSNIIISCEITNYDNSIYLHPHCSYNLISNNSIAYSSTGIELWYYGCHSNTIKMNNISFCSLNGISATGCEYNIISNNILINNSGNGICLLSCDYNTLEKNEIVNSSKNGVVISGQHNNISLNNISHSSLNGVFLKNLLMSTPEGIIPWGSDNNEILSNNIINNLGDGIHIQNCCSYNIIENNEIKNNNLVGIIVNGSLCEDNSIYKNYFITNSKHAIDLSGITYWNSLEIGNFWDNYTGSDFNDDGIGDIPYNISSNPLIQDLLPIWDDGDDPYPPELIIMNPTKYQIIGYESPEFEIVSKSLYINTTWYNVNNSIGSFIFEGFTGRIAPELWDQFSDGNITITFYANDSLGSVGSAEVMIEKDITLPLISIHSPIEGTIYREIAPAYNITVIEKNFLSCWYCLNYVFNVTISNLTGFISQSHWDYLPYGSVNITFYVKDKAGNIAYQNILITKELPKKLPSGMIPSYNSLLLIIGISLLSLIVLLRKRVKITTKESS